jgi:hypothetical protein
MWAYRTGGWQEGTIATASWMPASVMCLNTCARTSDPGKCAHIRLSLSGLSPRKFASSTPACPSAAHENKQNDQRTDLCTITNVVAGMPVQSDVVQRTDRHEYTLTSQAHTAHGVGRVHFKGAVKSHPCLLQTWSSSWAR